MSSFDVIVIGSGPGGYVSAIRAAQLGMKTALVEKYSTMGGTCLNVGCIPSKSLLDSSHHYENALHNFVDHGISIEGKIKLDLDKMMSRKSSVVEQTTKGLEYLMNKNKVTVFNGLGSFKDSTTVEVKNNGKSEVINGKNIIIATGSKPTKLPFVDFDGERIISTTEALKLKEVPKQEVVIGGGVIGLELGQVYNRLGSKVTVIEYQERIIPNMDSGLSKELTKVFKKSGVKVNTSHQVVAVKKKNNKLSVSIETNKKSFVQVFDKALIAIGRKPNTETLNINNTDVLIEENGFIAVNEYQQTSVDNIYAIGDIVGNPMLAHKATHQGKVAAEVCAGVASAFDVEAIPSVVYTDPEVAWVGLTENDAKEKNIKYEKGEFPWAASGRATVVGSTYGKTKILFSPENNKVLGVGIVGVGAGDIISEAVLAIEMGVDAEDLSLTVHPHPTLGETMGLAGEVFTNTITDLYIPKK
jgi:dihydrolipoamide dehydrogenase